MTTLPTHEMAAHAMTPLPLPDAYGAVAIGLTPTQLAQVVTPGVCNDSHLSLHLINNNNNSSNNVSYTLAPIPPPNTAAAATAAITASPPTATIAVASPHAVTTTPQATTAATAVANNTMIQPLSLLSSQTLAQTAMSSNTALAGTMSTLPAPFPATTTAALGSNATFVQGAGVVMANAAAAAAATNGNVATTPYATLPTYAANAMTCGGGGTLSFAHPRRAKKSTARATLFIKQTDEANDDNNNNNEGGGEGGGGDKNNNNNNTATAPAGGGGGAEDGDAATHAQAQPHTQQDKDAHDDKHDVSTAHHSHTSSASSSSLSSSCARMRADDATPGLLSRFACCVLGRPSACAAAVTATSASSPSSPATGVCGGAAGRDVLVALVVVVFLLVAHLSLLVRSERAATLLLSVRLNANDQLLTVASGLTEQLLATAVQLDAALLQGEHEYGRHRQPHGVSNTTSNSNSTDTTRKGDNSDSDSSSSSNSNDSNNTTSTRVQQLQREVLRLRTLRDRSVLQLYKAIAYAGPLDDVRFLVEEHVAYEAQVKRIAQEELTWLHTTRIQQQQQHKASLRHCRGDGVSGHDNKDVNGDCGDDDDDDDVMRTLYKGAAHVTTLRLPVHTAADEALLRVRWRAWALTATPQRPVVLREARRPGAASVSPEVLASADVFVSGVEHGTLATALDEGEDDGGDVMTASGALRRRSRLQRLLWRLRRVLNNRATRLLFILVLLVFYVWLR